MGWFLPLVAALGPSIISGGASALGQSSSNAASAREAQRQREFNAAEAQRGREFNAAEAEKARSFSAEQSATEVRRRMADLKAAGLNPALAYHGEASSGGGVAAQGPAASSSAAPQMQNVLGRGIETALAALSVKREFQRMEIEREVATADVLKKAAETSDILMTRAARLGELGARSKLADTQAENMKGLFAANLMLLQRQALRETNSARELDTRSRYQLQQRESLRLQTKREEEAFREAFGKWLPAVNSAGNIVGNLNWLRAFQKQSQRSLTINNFPR